ncbi:hypothetical protein MKW92_040825, partial [Papaver armeniacum]
VEEVSSYGTDVKEVSPSSSNVEEVTLSNTIPLHTLELNKNDVQYPMYRDRRSAMPSIPYYYPQLHSE